MTTIPIITNFDLLQIPVEGTTTFRAHASYVWSTIPTVITSINSATNAINTLAGEISAAVTAIDTDATTATTQAGIATTKAGEASTSAANALASQNATAAMLDSFDDRYLGAKTVEPTLDNDGNALAMGALYWFYNPADPLQDKMKVYDSALGVWVNQSLVPTSHTGLSGLSADDHTQYHNDTRGDARYYTKAQVDLAVEDTIGASIASATTTSIGLTGSHDYVHISGTTTITSFGTAHTAGIRRTVIFDGALTITHNTTSLICLGAANIVTVAGTILELIAETTANWRVVSISHPSVSMTELGYLDGVTSSIQAQLDNKTLSVALNTARATVASHATIAQIWTALGNQIDWTGTATTTIFPNAPQAGAERTLICAGACAFTAGANMLIDGVASGATVTCASGDTVIVRAISTTQFKLSRIKYDGTAQVSAGGGALTYIATVNAAGAASVVFEQFSATYDDYVIYADNVYGTALGPLELQVKTSGVYRSSGYLSHINLSTFSSATYGGTTSISSSSFYVLHMDSSSNEPGTAVIQLNNTNAATYPSIRWDSIETHNNRMNMGRGFNNVIATALQGVTLAPQSGTVTGSFRLYGIKKS